MQNSAGFIFCILVIYICTAHFADAYLWHMFSESFGHMYGICLPGICPYQCGPPGKAAPVPRGYRNDEAAQGASRKRSASAPVKPNKWFAYHSDNHTKDFIPIVFIFALMLIM